MAGMKKLDIAPISACAVTTGQKDGKSAIRERSDRQRDHARRNQRSFRLEPINQSARRRLRCDAGDSANRERKAHALLVPAIAGKVDREERPHAALHVGEQEV